MGVTSSVDRGLAAHFTKGAHSSVLVGISIPWIFGIAAVGVEPHAFIRTERSGSTNASSVTAYHVTDADLVLALNRVVDKLLRQQVSLDRDVKSFLYKKRWELYD
jgi:hypothetical protein